MDNQPEPNLNCTMGVTPLYEVPAAVAASAVALDGDVSANSADFDSTIDYQDDVALMMTMDNQPEPNSNHTMGVTPLYEVPAAAAASVVVL